MPAGVFPQLDLIATLSKWISNNNSMTSDDAFCKQAK